MLDLEEIADLQLAILGCPGGLREEVCDLALDAFCLGRPRQGNHDMWPNRDPIELAFQQVNRREHCLQFFKILAACR